MECGVYNHFIFLDNMQRRVQVGNHSHVLQYLLFVDIDDSDIQIFGGRVEVVGGVNFLFIITLFPNE